MTPCLLERLLHARGRVAVMLASAIGLALSAAAEAVLVVSRDRHHWIMEMSYAAWLIVLPGASIVMSRSWRGVHERLLWQLGWQPAAREQFVQRWHRRIFGANTPAVILSGALTLVGGASIVSMGPAYDSTSANVAALLIFLVVLATAGIFTWSVLAYVGSLWLIATHTRPGTPTRILAAQHPAFSKFERYWIWVSAFTSTGYVLISVATRNSPYLGIPMASVWLWIAAAAPALIVGVALLLVRWIRIETRNAEQADVLARLARLWRNIDSRGTNNDLESAVALSALADSVARQGGLPATMRILSPLFLAFVPSFIEIYAASRSSGR